MFITVGPFQPDRQFHRNLPFRRFSAGIVNLLFSASGAETPRCLAVVPCPDPYAMCLMPDASYFI